MAVHHSTFEESMQAALQGPDTQQVARPAGRRQTQRETTMSKLARVLAVGALLTAMSLGSAAHAQTSGTPPLPASGTPSQPADATQPGPNPAPGTTTTTTTTATTPPLVPQKLTVSASPAQGRPGTTVALTADLGRCPELTSANGAFYDHAGRSRPLAGLITRASQFIARYTVTGGDAAGQGRFQVDCLHDTTVVGRGSVNFQVLSMGPVSVAVSPSAGRPGTVVTVTAKVRGGCDPADAFFQDRKGLGVPAAAKHATIVAHTDRQLIARYTVSSKDAPGPGRVVVACGRGTAGYRVGSANFQVQTESSRQPGGSNPHSGGANPPSGGQVDYGNGGTVQVPDRIDTGQGGTADGTRHSGLDPVWLLPLAGLLLIAAAVGLRLRQASRRRP
jgi:hypothetical protein